MSNITLTATQRNTILSLQQVTSQFNTTQQRLNSGKKVNTVTDNAVAYFRSQGLYNRSSDILNRKSTIDQSIQSVQSALTATSAVEGLLKQLQGVLEGARGSTLSQRVSATAQFKNIAQQLAQLVKDASYQGLNILTSSSTTLATQFSERTAATFTITGYNLVATGTNTSNNLFTQAAAFKADGSLVFSAVVGDLGLNNSAVGFSALNILGGTATGGDSNTSLSATTVASVFTGADTRISNAISQLQGIAAALGTNVAILTARSEFSAQYASNLQAGGDSLTLADLNLEAANSQALTLRQQLGIQSLSISGTQNQSILTLLR
jgi:flagellin-like hook-associated protein FlgL